jgi:hypothetical protein
VEDFVGKGVALGQPLPDHVMGACNRHRHRPVIRAEKGHQRAVRNELLREDPLAAISK